MGVFVMVVSILLSIAMLVACIIYLVWFINSINSIKYASNSAVSLLRQILHKLDINETSVQQVEKAKQEEKFEVNAPISQANPTKLIGEKEMEWLNNEVSKYCEKINGISIHSEFSDQKLMYIVGIYFCKPDGSEHIVNECMPSGLFNKLIKNEYYSWKELGLSDPKEN